MYTRELKNISYELLKENMFEEPIATSKINYYYTYELYFTESICNISELVLFFPRNTTHISRQLL